MISCSSGIVRVGYEGDTCNFTCATGYMLTGSRQRTCQSNGSWSGSPAICTIMKCNSSSLPVNSMLPQSCNNTYQSRCELQCQEGFSSTGNPLHTCDVSEDKLSVMWNKVGGKAWSCKGK